MTKPVLLLALAALLAMAFSSCTPINPTPAPQPADCAAVCAHGFDLGCAWSRPTPNGVTCVQVCEDANTILPWSSECLASAATCEEADRCR